MRTPGIFLFAGAVTLGLAACNGDGPPRPLSLDQAQKVAAQFQSDSFIPPPRTIDDITAILDQQSADTAQIDADKKAADAQPPAGAAPKDLFAFYFTRSQHAEHLGRYQQQVTDLQEALRLGQSLKADIELVTRDLMRAQFLIGNFAAALDAAKLSQASIPPQNMGAPIASWAALAINYALLGDMADADNAIAKAQAQLQSLNTPNGTYAQITVRTRYGAGLEAGVLSAQATVATAHGNYREAELDFKQALPLIDTSLHQVDTNRGTVDSTSSMGGPTRESVESQQTRIMLALASNLQTEGKLLEAEVYTRQALMLLLQRRSRYSPETMAAVVGLVSILNEQGRYGDAEKLGQIAVSTYETLGAGEGSWALAQARSLVAGAQAAQGRWSDAAASVAKLEQVLGSDPAGRDKFIASNLIVGVVDLNTGHAAEAQAIFARVLARRTQSLGPNAPGTAEAQGLLAMATAQSGASSAALAAFDKAMPGLLRSNDEASDAEIETVAHDRIVREVIDADMTALANAGGSGNAEKAFSLVDAAHGQSTQRALSSSSARATTTDPALADLIRRYQDAQLHLASLQDSLADDLAAPAAQQDASIIQSLQSQSDTLKRAVTTIHQEIAQRFPGYERLINPPPPNFADVQQSLQTGEALIATHVTKDRVYVWAVPKSGPPAFAVASIAQPDLVRMVSDLRHALDPGGIATIGDIPPYDVALAYRLYTALLQPVAAGWRGAKTLIIVPDGALAQIPFDLLVTAPAVASDGPGQAIFAGYQHVPFLIRQAAVTELPSIGALTTLRALPPGDPDRRAFVGFGDPWFNAQEAAAARASAAPQVAALQSRGIRLRAVPSTEKLETADLGVLPRLPDTADEVREVASTLKADPQTDVFLGAEASEHRVTSMRLDDRRVLMFATHGLVPGDLDGLTQPALALTAPTISGDGGDGLLTMDRILGLKLDADWVVLSACNTAAGDGKGADAISGLGRAFFYAGARALLVSNWPVETTSARLLTTGTFRHQTADRAMTRAEALRQAELDLIDGPGYSSDGRPVFSYAHPIFWAPFSLVGDGGN